MGLPFLSFTTTASTTSCTFTDSVKLSCAIGRPVLSDLLRARSDARKGERDEHGSEHSRIVQNLSRMVACRLRIGFADAAGRTARCRRVVFQLVKTA